jgi:hypothetical protein
MDFSFCVLVHFQSWGRTLEMRLGPTQQFMNLLIPATRVLCPQCGLAFFVSAGLREPLLGGF